MNKNKPTFENLMEACLQESNKAASKKIEKEKALKEKALKENKKKNLKEAEGANIDELSVEPEVEEMPDIEDDIAVVIDPSLSEEEMLSASKLASEIIDSTPEGDIPEDNTYVGDLVYLCPVCGSTFFSGEELADGSECPVCGEYPEKFVLRGEVASVSTEEVTEDEESKEVEDAPAADTSPELDIDVKEDDEEVEKEDEGDEGLEERYMNIRRSLESKHPVRRGRARVNENTRKQSVRRPARKSTTVRESNRQLALDERTFNREFTSFVRQNYKNVISMKVEGCRKRGSKFILECVVKTKDGRERPVSLTTDNFMSVRGVQRLAFIDNGLFKVESRGSNPFRISIKNDGRTLTCEGFEYNFRTIKENRAVSISNRPATESARRTNPARTSSRPAPARAPRARRVSESRQVPKQSTKQAPRRVASKPVAESRQVPKKFESRTSRRRFK